MGETVVEIRGLVRSFGRRRVLDGVDLALGAGSVTALVGENGAGKSTLLRCVAGIVPASAGRVRALGLDPARAGAKLRARIGYVPERLELPAWMRVGAALRFFAAFYPTWSAAEERRLACAFELDPRERVRTLSKGARAKLALLVALAHGPELLLLDEPFSGLDPGVRKHVLAALVGHLRDPERTVLLVTHSLDDVERAADRVALLADGRVRACGETEELRERFARVRSLAGGLEELFGEPFGEPFDGNGEAA